MMLICVIQCENNLGIYRMLSLPPMEQKHLMEMVGVALVHARLADALVCHQFLDNTKKLSFFPMHMSKSVNLLRRHSQRVFFFFFFRFFFFFFFF